MQEQEEEEEKVDITIIPEIPSGWNMGRFQIVMNHWTNWPRAQSTVGLQEAVRSIQMLDYPKFITS